MQFICSPILGSLSDRFGRRKVILLSNLGLGLDYLLMAVAPSLWWLFVGRVISGVTSSSFGTACAYVADVTAPEDRAKKFGMLGVAFGVGFIVGPPVGGLLGAIDLRAPFWGAAVLSLANAAYGFFILPESLPLERRSSFHWRRANPIGSIQLLRSRPQLFRLGSAGFLSMLAHDSLPITFVLYTTYLYHWDQRTIGLVLAAVGVMSIVVQGGLVGRLVAALGERRALAVGFASGAVGMTVYGLAPTGRIFVLGVAMTALYGLAGPSLQSLMTSRVGPAEQGQLQGAVGSLNGIANMIAPVLFTQVFALAIGPFQRSPRARRAVSARGTAAGVGAGGRVAARPTRAHVPAFARATVERLLQAQARGERRARYTSRLMPILGLHHVTATVDEAQPDLDFCLKGLGLRLVKKTVNFDNHFVYHFYYGDERGTPGTIWTTFPYAGRGVAAGRKGAGQVTVTSFSVPAGSLDAWRTRLAATGHRRRRHRTALRRAGDRVCGFLGPDLRADRHRARRAQAVGGAGRRRGRGDPRPAQRDDPGSRSRQDPRSDDHPARLPRRRRRPAGGFASAAGGDAPGPPDRRCPRRECRRGRQRPGHCASRRHGDWKRAGAAGAARGADPVRLPG